MEASLSFLSMYVQTYSTHLHPYIPRDHHPLRLWSYLCYIHVRWRQRAWTAVSCAQPRANVPLSTSLFGLFIDVRWYELNIMTLPDPLHIEPQNNLLWHLEDHQLQLRAFAYHIDIVLKSNIFEMSSCQETLSKDRNSQTTPSRPSNRMSSTQTEPDAQGHSRTTSVDSDLSHYLYFEDNDSFFPPSELGEKPSPDGKDRSHGPYVDSSVQTWDVTSKLRSYRSGAVADTNPVVDSLGILWSWPATLPSHVNLSTPYSPQVFRNNLLFLSQNPLLLYISENLYPYLVPCPTLFITSIL